MATFRAARAGRRLAFRLGARPLCQPNVNRAVKSAAIVPPSDPSDSPLIGCVLVLAWLTAALGPGQRLVVRGAEATRAGEVVRAALRPPPPNPFRRLAGETS